MRKNNIIAVGRKDLFVDKLTIDIDFKNGSTKLAIIELATNMLCILASQSLSRCLLQY